MKIHHSLATLAGCLGLIASACGDSPTDSAGFEIVSPSSTNATVDARDSLRFEVRTAGGFTSEFVIDDTRTVPGPVFFLDPSARSHTVLVRVFPPDPAVPPITRLFNVTVSGNIPPVIESFSLSPTTGEAVRDRFVASVQARDPDGSIESVAFDFGDATSPEVVSGPGPAFQASHVFGGPGSFVVRATITDSGGEIEEATIDLQVAPFNRAPTGNLTARPEGGGDTEGNAPLTVMLDPEGNDVDGSIVRWEIDPDDGSGFQQIAANETLVVEYGFRDTAYEPRLRLTDNGGADTVLMGPVITVFRGVSSAESRVLDVSGNPRFANLGIAPAVWSNGQDPLSFRIEVRNAQGDPIPDVPLRVISQRPDFIAPDGVNLGGTVVLLNALTASSGLAPSAGFIGELRTNGGGVATGRIATNTSTLADVVERFNFVPFDLRIEADNGHGELVDVAVVRDLDAETTVLFSGGGFQVFSNRPQGICPGDQIRIRLTAEQRPGAPGGSGPASDRYTVLRFGEEFSGAVPTSEFADWRTNQDGWIEFLYTPEREDDDRRLRAWVDGLPIEPVALLSLLDRSRCGGV